MTRPPRPRRISELLSEPGSTLASLARGVEAHEDLRRTVADALPAPLRLHLLSAAVSGDALILSVDDPSWASRIRFHQGPCLAAARRLTGDGVLVVAHDPRLNPALARGPDGRWLATAGPVIRRMSFAALAAYDIGRLDPASRYAARFPEQQPVDGARIPSFDQVVALTRAAGATRVRFNLETKLSPLQPELSAAPEVLADAVVAAIRRHGIAGRATVQSFDWRTLRRVQEVAPEIATVCLTAEREWLDNLRAGQAGASPWTAGLDVDAYAGSVPRLVHAAGCAVWSPYWRDLDPGRLAEAHGLGLAVIPWTVNRAAEMERLIGLGVDGLITDYPDRLRAAMSRNRLPLPPATPVEQ